MPSCCLHDVQNRTAYNLPAARKFVRVGLVPQAQPGAVRLKRDKSVAIRYLMRQISAWAKVDKQWSGASVTRKPAFAARSVQFVSALRLEVRRGQLEVRELEAGRNRTADQRPRAEAVRLLPGARRHDGLRALAGGEVDAQRSVAARACIVGDGEEQRRAGMPVPDLGRIDPVPARNLAVAQQEIDGGGGRARAVRRRRVAERLAEMPALRMRRQVRAGG